MKKLLALVLALVMTLGLATVGANAALKDYSDADSIDADYTEAFAVMNTVGVFQGSDGKLTPTDKLTRAQAAKLIAYLDLGGDIAETLPAVQVFADVPATHWAAKYVAYCQQAGIIQGAEANKFYPDGELTGYAFGAYLLAVLGYDRNIEGITGADWAIKAASLMGAAGIGDGVDKAGSATLTREEAAQYCLETLMAPVVEYADKGTTITTETGTVINTGAKAASYVTTSPYDQAISAEGNGDILQLGEKLYKGTLTLAGNTTKDAFGNPAETWNFKGVKVGTYNTKDAATTYTTSMKSTASVATVKADIKDYNNYSGTGASTWALYQNGFQTTVKNYESATDGVASLTGNGTLVKVFRTSTTNNVDRVTVTDTFLGKVKSVSEKDKNMTITVTFAATSIDLKTTKGYGDFAKDDYVLLTISDTDDGVPDATNSTIQSVAAANKVTGISTTKSTANNTITIDGTAYKQAAQVVTANNVANFTVNANYEATLYTDADGNILYAKSGAATTTDKAVAVLRQYQSLNSAGRLIYMIEGVTSNGATVNWYVSDSNPNLTANEVYTYDYSSASGKYTLTQDNIVRDNVTGNATTVNLGATTVNKNGSGNRIIAADRSYTVNGGVAYYDSNVKFIFVKGNAATVLDGVQNIPDATQVYATIKVSGGTNYITAVYALTDSPVSTTDSSDVVFVGNATGNYSATNSKTNLVENFKTYDAYINGEEVEGFYAAEGAAAGFYKVSKNADTGAYILTDATKYAATTGANAVDVGAKYSASAGNVLTVTGGTISDYDLTNATIIDLISDNGTDYDTLAELKDYTNVAKVSISMMYNRTTGMVSYVYLMDSFALNSYTYETHGLTITVTPNKSEVSAGDAVVYTVKVKGTADDTYANDQFTLDFDTYVAGSADGSGTPTYSAASNGNITAGAKAVTIAAQSVNSSYTVSGYAKASTVTPVLTYASNYTWATSAAQAKTDIEAHLAALDGVYDSNTVNVTLGAGRDVSGFTVSSGKTVAVVDDYAMTIKNSALTVNTSGKLTTVGQIIPDGTNGGSLVVYGDVVISDSSAATGGIPSGDGAITVASSGKLTVTKGGIISTGAIDFSGEVVITAGGLNLSSATTPDISGNVTVTAGNTALPTGTIVTGTLTTNAQTTLAGTISLDGLIDVKSGAVVFTSTPKIQSADTSNTTKGSGGELKVAGTALTCTAAPTFDYGVKLTLSNTGTVATTANGITVDRGAYINAAGSLTIADTKPLTIGANGKAYVDVAGTLSVTGASGDLTITNGDVSVNVLTVDQALALTAGKLTITTKTVKAVSTLIDGATGNTGFKVVLTGGAADVDPWTKTFASAGNPGGGVANPVVTGDIAANKVLTWTASVADAADGTAVVGGAWVVGNT